MAYITVDDLMGRISESDLIVLTDDTDSGEIGSDNLNGAIADASAEIDGYCGGRYTTPFEPVPDSVRTRCVDMTIYHLHARRGGAPEDRKNRYDSAVTWLKMVSEGKVDLGIPGSASPDPSGVQFRDAGRKFTRDGLKDY